ncbi:MAG: hypothetical protein Q9190_003349 [Brigantiaea leucoxantha]
MVLSDQAQGTTAAMPVSHMLPPQGPPRAQTFHGAKSFSRMDSANSSPLARSRASTLENETVREETSPEKRATSTNANGAAQEGDIFEKDSTSALSSRSAETLDKGQIRDLPEGFDDLPIELQSLTDRYGYRQVFLTMADIMSRFIESLTAKVYPEPPSIERLSDMFQDFYVKAESHIATHISSLSVKQLREASPTPSTSSKSPATRSRAMSTKEPVDSSDRRMSDQQMLTPQEISDRRKARRLLEQKRIALEEAVERRVCERVYKRIWRHRSTLDEVRDEKLRSRTAALALVGIGFKDLGISLDGPMKDAQGSDALESQIEGWFSPARNELLRMNEARYPWGKLQHLAAAHKIIVDLLSNLRQSSSSADDILPSLIYTLITTPPEGINIISNMSFTQRFRAASKMDGEAAYCLTNLEAAITFLETVDLASLRSDEPLEGPVKTSSRPATPRDEKATEWATEVPRSAPNPTAPIAGSPKPLFSDPLRSPTPSEDTPPSSPSHQRRLSHLFQPPQNAFGAASDAVRSTADQGIRNIGSTLDNSFRFLFGRLKEQHIAVNDDNLDGAIVLPRTLDDARRLVDPKSTINDDGDMSAASSIAEKPDARNENPSKVDDRLLGAFAGRRQQPRERSVDSLQSSGSGKKTAFTRETEGEKDKASSTSQLPTSSKVQQDTVQTPTAVESMRTLGNALNPLNRFAGMSVMRGFGRNSSGSTPTLATTLSPDKVPAEAAVDTSTSSQTSAVFEPSQPALPKLLPPVQRFLEATDTGDLKVSEVAELLTDYKRLANALKSEGRF